MPWLADSATNPKGCFAYYPNCAKGSPEKIAISPPRREERKGFALVFLRVLGVFAVQMGFSQCSHERFELVKFVQTAGDLLRKNFLNRSSFPFRVWRDAEQTGEGGRSVKQADGRLDLMVALDCRPGYDPRNGHVFK